MFEFIKSLQENITEAPISDYELLGNFDRSHGFRHAVDRRLLQSPTNTAKVLQFFEKTPYDFRVYAVNSPGASRYSEYGPMQPKEVKEVFPQFADRILQDTENKITVVFVGNTGDARVMITPWMMAHRFGHAIQAGNRGGYYNRNFADSAWGQAEEFFFKEINIILKEYYGKTKNREYSSQLAWNLEKEYAALFNAIGTQRSSRMGLIRRPYEFMYEMFAQYLGTGRITFNPLPRQQSYGRMAWGRPTRALNYRGDDGYRDISWLANDMTYYFSSVLADAVGKVYIM